MKKIIAVLTVLMCFASANAFAQLKEVRGVQTRVIKYEKNDIEKEIYSDGKWGKTIHGFEFKNENNYPVWVEAELCTNGYDYRDDGKIEAGTYDTKSFTLNPGETYVWKIGDKMIKHNGYANYDRYDNYYVKYKAYKAE